MWGAIADQLAEALDRPVEVVHRSAVSGGCIHQTSRIETRAGEPFFVKVNNAGQLPAFEAEVAALQALREAGAIRVPTPHCCGRVGDQAFLAMEHIKLQTRGDESARGRALADLHRHTHKQFGWAQDNFLGPTLQRNGWTDAWIPFFKEKRLGFQIELAAKNGTQFKGVDRLLERVDVLFSEYDPPPSLLHGDLWGGNAAFGPDGEPVIFDPASYYGDREADLALTELFGGFDGEFYRAYDEAWPLHPGYTMRKTLYNLYHVLNHYNLFGGSYRQQAQSMIDRLLAEVG